MWLFILIGVPGEFIPSEEPHLMDQREKIFIPHVLPILKEEKVAFLNSDPFLHNVHAYLGRETLFNMAIMKSSKPKPRVKSFNQVGEHVILCDVHPEMEAWIIVLESPYFAIIKKNGSYKIENVPTETYILKTWHKKLKSQSREITVGESETVEVDLTLHRD